MVIASPGGAQVDWKLVLEELINDESIAFTDGPKPNASPNVAVNRIYYL